MIAPEKFVEALGKIGINFVTGVPDSLLKDLCAKLTVKLPAENHVIAANEGSAIGRSEEHTSNSSQS